MAHYYPDQPRLDCYHYHIVWKITAIMGDSNHPSIKNFDHRNHSAISINHNVEGWKVVWEWLPVFLWFFFTDHTITNHPENVGV